MAVATKAKAKPSAKLTTREKLALLKEAYRLIRKPESYVHGKWRCAIYERNPETGAYGHAVDGKGRKLWQYCIEGALNQGAVNLFGLERAQALGAVAESCVVAEWLDDESGTKYLEQQALGEKTSLDTLADEIYGPLYRKLWEEHNPGYSTDEKLTAMSVNDNERFGHKAVVKLLRTKIKAVEAQVEKLDARKKVTA